MPQMQDFPAFCKKKGKKPSHICDLAMTKLHTRNLKKCCVNDIKNITDTKNIPREKGDRYITHPG